MLNSIAALMYHAAKRNHCEGIAQAYAAGAPIPTSAIMAAASGGHTSLVKFLHQEVGLELTEYMLTSAVAGGYSDTVEYLLQYMTVTPRDVDAAVRHGHVHIMELFMRIGVVMDDATMAYAIEQGTLAAIDFLRAHCGIRLLNSHLLTAVNNRDIELIIYLAEHGIVCSRHNYEIAEMIGFLDDLLDATS